MGKNIYRLEKVVGTHLTVLACNETQAKVLAYSFVINDSEINRDSSIEYVERVQLTAMGWLYALCSVLETNVSLKDDVGVIGGDFENIQWPEI